MFTSGSESCEKNISFSSDGVYYTQLLIIVVSEMLICLAEVNNADCVNRKTTAKTVQCYQTVEWSLGFVASEFFVFSIEITVVSL